MRPLDESFKIVDRVMVCRTVVRASNMHMKTKNVLFKLNSSTRLLNTSNPHRKFFFPLKMNKFSNRVFAVYIQ